MAQSLHVDNIIKHSNGAFSRLYHKAYLSDLFDLTPTLRGDSTKVNIHSKPNYNLTYYEAEDCFNLGNPVIFRSL